MIKDIEIAFSPEKEAKIKDYNLTIARKLNIPEEDIKHIELVKRSIDARSSNVVFRIKFKVFINELPDKKEKYNIIYPDVSKSKRVIIVGAGPAGLFAALQLIEKGIKPVIIERGKDVSSRKVDIASINKNRKINPDSNYCFGEGGAGAFSDGKLFTRSSKRGDIKKILHVFVKHGASKDILIDAHPHIGSDKLPAIISSMRESILNSGGEIFFQKRVCDLIIIDKTAKGVTDQNDNNYEGEAVILASGHSARDIYELLHRKNIHIESKEFAIGFRLEHPQELIDTIQYHSIKKNPYLPAARYSLSSRSGNRGVYSFCMCPGGIIVAAATDKDQVVVNGMSNSKRNSPYANSGIVVEVGNEDFKQFEKYGPLAAMKYQESLEKNAFIAGGENLQAPAQRLSEFVNGNNTASLPETSYNPGIVASDFTNIIHEDLRACLKQGLISFGRKMRGFLSSEAVLLGVETRTSSPVKIPRKAETLEHIEIKRLFPCGEGAGYAGGIVSSAVDGENCAMKIAEIFRNH